MRGDNKGKISGLQATFLTEFEMTNLIQASQYLGVEFEYHGTRM
jgi:hypothetical protein